MKFIISAVLLFCCLTLSLASPLSPSDSESADAEQNKRWNEFKTSHGKEYGSKEAESKRKTIFFETDRRIQDHNKGKSTFKCAHNHLSDRTEEEVNLLCGAKLPKNADTTLYSSTAVDPELYIMSDSERQSASLDYRNDSCLAAVKDQGQCGSCWTFATIAPVEFASCKAKKVLNVLSEQQLVDCSPGSGCNGGWPGNAYSYLVGKGSDSSQSYPYKAVQGTCQYSASNVKAKITSWVQIPAGTGAETAMMNALKTYGPLTVAIQVQGLWPSYNTGVYDDPTCPTTAGSMNHGVVIVGYGTDTASGLNYWAVRNSWGASWGNKGYILMRRGTNLCNIERYAMYPTGAS